MLISLIVPTLNEASTIAQLATHLADLPGEFEILVADGGSTDETVRLAEAAGLRVIAAPRGRGPQMNAAAKLAQGDVLLFLHADTRLPASAWQQIVATLQDSHVSGGNFSLQFDGNSQAARFLTRLYPCLRWGGMCYGDSAMFVRRSTFAALGGYREFPLFEDCDLYRRLKRTGQFVHLAVCATTSARRFEGKFVRTFALWSMLQLLYWLGVPPRWLHRLYLPLR